MAGGRLFVLALLFAACSPAGSSGESPASSERPAAAVPLVALTEADAGTPRAAEAGDSVEVRLPEGGSAEDRWVLGTATGPASLASERVENGERVFRFSTAGAGRSRLSFTRGDRALDFVVDTR